MNLEQETEARIRGFCAAYQFRPDTEANRRAVEHGVRSIVREHYARGGAFLDRDEDSIISFDEIDIVVTMGGHRMDVLVTRTSESWAAKLKGL